jgi:hypothetical protein
MSVNSRKKSFKQIEIQERLDELETKICDLELTILAGEALEGLVDLEEKKTLLEVMLNEKIQLNKAMRKLELNRARQRRLRRKRKEEESPQPQVHPAIQVQTCWSVSSDDCENNSIVLASEFEFLNFLSHAIRSDLERDHIQQIVDQRVFHLEKQNI